MSDNRGAATSDAKRGAINLQGPRGKPVMFKILELKGTESAPATEVGRHYSTRAEALAAIKTHLITRAG